MNYFHNWGIAIAGGDWLSASVGVPMHTWHHEVATRYFTTHPDARLELERQAASAANGSTPDSLLWAKWTGGHQFYQDPLHAYMVGATYALVGTDPRFVIAWQMLLGVVSVVLIYLIAVRYFGEMAGAISGAFAILCGPLMYYEGLLLRDSTITCASLGVVWLTQYALDTRKTVSFALLGVLLGLGIMLKSTFALLAVIVTVGVVLAMRRREGSLKSVAVLVSCIIIGIAPFGIRNIALGVPPLAMAGSGTLTFVASNDPGYPSVGGFFVNNNQLAEVLGRSDGRLVPAIVETLRAHSMASFAGLLWSRFQAGWHWYEVPNNISYYYVQLMTPVLRWLPVTFYAVAPLALVGLVFATKRWREVWPLLAVVLSTIVSLALFLVLGRLRLLLLASTIPFAAQTIVRFVHAGRRVRIASVLAVLSLGAWTGRPLPDERSLMDLTDWLTPFLVDYKNDVRDALDAHDNARAAAAYLAFLRYEPDFAGFEHNGAVLARPADREVARTFAQIHDVCGRLLAESGQLQKAGAEHQKAEALSRLAAQ
jgi:4-amino-4-deoxy-L-arabinose transferase-like glycosyltransferase